MSMWSVVVADEERVPLDAVDLFDASRFSAGSQHPTWHTLRAEAPLWRQRSDDGTEFCSVTRYEDVLTVLKDHRRLSSAHGTILAVLGGDSAAGRTINLMDRPGHAAIRGATMPLLSPPTVHRLSELIRDRVRAILAPCRDGGVVDLAPLMAHLPMAAVGDLIGVPENEWPDVVDRAMAGVAPLDPLYADETDDLTLRTAHFELFAMFRDIVRDRMRSPRHDIVSVLLECVVDGRKLSIEDVVLNCYSLVMGASTTTPHVASHLLLALAERPEPVRNSGANRTQCGPADFLKRLRRQEWAPDQPPCAYRIAALRSLDWA